MKKSIITLFLLLIVMIAASQEKQSWSSLSTSTQFMTYGVGDKVYFNLGPFFCAGKIVVKDHTKDRKMFLVRFVVISVLDKPGTSFCPPLFDEVWLSRDQFVNGNLKR